MNILLYKNTTTINQFYHLNNKKRRHNNITSQTRRGFKNQKPHSSSPDVGLIPKIPLGIQASALDE